MPRPSLRNGHSDDAVQLGQSALFPAAAGRRRAATSTSRRERAGCRRLSLAGAAVGASDALALHGLNGSSDAHYMRGLAAKAFARGMNVVRLNQRNCGDTEHLAEGLFHSGLTADAAHVVHELTRRRRAARDRGRRLFARRQPRAQARRRVRPARAARRSSPSPRCRRSSRSASARARSSGRRTCCISGISSRDLKRRMRRKDAAPSRRVRPDEAERDQDRARVRRHLHRAVLRLPRRRGLLLPRQRDARRSIASASRRSIITAEDDPFVPSQPFRDPKRHRQSAHRPARVRARRPLRLRRPAVGGDDDGYWAENRIVDFVGEHAGALC